MNRMTADIWTGLRTAPARTGLAFFSLALGLFAVTILLATMDALKRQARELVQQFGAESMVLLRTGTVEVPWTWDRVDYFRRNLGEAAWVGGVKVLADQPGVEVAVASVDESLAAIRGMSFVSGRALDMADIHEGTRHAMAPVDLCRRHGWQVGQIILLGTEAFRLVGCFDAGGWVLPPLPENAVLIPFTADVLETGEEHNAGRVDALMFRARPDTAPEALRRRIEALLHQPDMDRRNVEWITPDSLLRDIRQWQRAVAWTAGAGGGLGLLLGAATLAGMLMTGVRERIPEIGLRRALGARRREIASLFVAEAMALTGMAALVGMGLAEGVLRWLGIRFPLPFYFGATARLIPMALALAIAVLCSLGPAWRASWLPPAEALRNE